MTNLADAMTELLYRSYRAQRDNGADHGLLHRSGVYGDEIDNFSDRYYAEQQAEERRQAWLEGDSDLPTMLEWETNQYGGIR